MNRSEQIVVDSVHAAGAAVPATARIEIFRAHARTTAHDRIAKHFFECADELAAAEQRCQQLVLDFKRRAEG